MPSGACTPGARRGDNARAVKTFRVCLLLLALLLPVRGVLAAAMMCPPAGGSGAPVEAHAAHVDAQAPAAHGGAHHHGAPEATGAAAAHDDVSPRHADDCTLCSAACAATPIASAASRLPLVQGAGRTLSCAPDAAAPSFLCGGQERPPRSI